MTKRKYKLKLTEKELCAIYDWMQYADNKGDSPFMTDDEDIRALVKKIQNKYECYINLKNKNNE